jgi:hypothetical protein
LDFKQQDKREATEEDASEWRLPSAQARIDMIKIAALDHRPVWSFSPTHERDGSSSSITHSKIGSCEYKAGIVGAGAIRCAWPSNRLSTGTIICRAEDREYQDERGGLYHTVRGTTRRNDSCGRICMNMNLHHRERLGLKGSASRDSRVSYFADAIR